MPLQTISKTFFALGTMNTIQVYGAEDSHAVDLAVARVYEIHNRMSVFHEESDIFRLNAKAGAGPVKIHPETYRLLKLSKEYSAATSGAFDATIRPLTSLWAFGSGRNDVPSEDAIREALLLTGYQNLILYENDSAAELKAPGQCVDLGGIAKGYAGDEIKRILMENGVHNALVNLGGNIVAMGRNPKGMHWKIGIQNPLRPRGQSLHALSVQDKSVVTSGSNERFFMKNGRRYHHILDPKTGMPAQNALLSATVIATSGTDADALSTALFVSGAIKPGEKAPKFRIMEELLTKSSAGAVFVTKDLNVSYIDFNTACVEKVII